MQAVDPAAYAAAWKPPHFMLLSFYLCVVILIGMAIISWCDRSKPEAGTSLFNKVEREKAGILVAGLWIALILVMIGLYIFFN